MSPIRIEKPRRLVLNRETVRTLGTGHDFMLTMNPEIAKDSSCGAACTCACAIQQF